MDDDALQLFFMIAIGVFFAFAEALDLDVLLGIIFMPVMKAMKYLADKFNNIQLDPSYWMDMAGRAYNDMCKNSPAGFVGTDFSFFVFFVVLILFEADISKWWRERGLRAQGYESLDDEGEDPAADEKLERLFYELDVDRSGLISRSEMDG